MEDEAKYYNTNVKVDMPSLFCLSLSPNLKTDETESDFEKEIKEIISLNMPSYETDFNQRYKNKIKKGINLNENFKKIINCKFLTYKNNHNEMSQIAYGYTSTGEYAFKIAKIDIQDIYIFLNEVMRDISDEDNEMVQDDLDNCLSDLNDLIENDLIENDYNQLFFGIVFPTYNLYDVITDTDFKNNNDIYHLLEDNFVNIFEFDYDIELEPLFKRLVFLENDTLQYWNKEYEEIYVKN